MLIGAALLFIILGFATFCPSLLSISPRVDKKEPWYNLQGLITAEENYFSKHGEYLRVEVHPPEMPGHAPINWFESKSKGLEGFQKLGWSPDGATHCQYAISSNRVDSYTIAAVCNFDDRQHFIGYVGAPKEKKGIAGPFGRCAPSGTLTDQPEICATNSIGPCTTKSKLSVGTSIVRPNRPPASLFSCKQSGPNTQANGSRPNTGSKNRGESDDTTLDENRNQLQIQELLNSGILVPPGIIEMHAGKDSQELGEWEAIALSPGQGPDGRACTMKCYRGMRCVLFDSIVGPMQMCALHCEEDDDCPRDYVCTCPGESCSVTVSDAPRFACIKAAPPMPRSHIYLGLLEQGQVNAEAGEGKTQKKELAHIRVAFMRDQEGWHAIKTPIDFGPGHRFSKTLEAHEWLATHNGQALEGGLRITLKEKWKNYSSKGAYSLSSPMGLPLIGTPDSEFSGWMRNKVFRPLVVTSSSTVKSSESWTAVHESAVDTEAVKKHFLDEVGVVSNCKSANEKPSQVDVTISDVAIVSLRLSRLGAALVSVKLRDQYLCDLIAGDEWRVHSF
ncbi:hypothetical protein KAI87_07745, partial [Myxococcota bacterium]|nr:hypothetical protein [Myxococcota bacterium]